MSKKHAVAKSGSQGARLRLNVVKQTEYVRAREPVSPTCGKVVGYFPSFKNSRQIAWESQLEKKACLLFEFSSVVKLYSEQPSSIRFPHQGNLLKYTPDFVVELTCGGRVFVEVKPLSKLNCENLKERLTSIDAYFSQKSLAFIVVTDEELNQPTRLQNLNFLRPHLSSRCSEPLVSALVADFTESTSTPLASLIDYTGSLNKSYSLIAQGHFSFDLDTHLTLETQLTYSKEKTNETCLFEYRSAPNFGKHSLCDKQDY